MERGVISEWRGWWRCAKCDDERDGWMERGRGQEKSGTHGINSNRIREIGTTDKFLQRSNACHVSWWRDRL